MRKRIGFALILGLLIGYPFELAPQAMSEEEKKLIQEYLQKNTPNGAFAIPSPAVRTQYKTSSMYATPSASRIATPQVRNKSPLENRLELEIPAL